MSCHESIYCKVLILRLPPSCHKLDLICCVKVFCILRKHFKYFFRTLANRFFNILESKSKGRILERYCDAFKNSSSRFAFKAFCFYLVLSLEFIQVGLRKLLYIGNTFIYVFMAWLRSYNFRKKYTFTLKLFLHFSLETTMQSCHNARE